jgi:transposase-like protein
MITDKLKSYGAARKDMGLGIEHRQHKGQNRPKMCQSYAEIGGHSQRSSCFG